MSYLFRYKPSENPENNKKKKSFKNVDRQFKNHIRESKQGLTYSKISFLICLMWELCVCAVQRTNHVTLHITFFIFVDQAFWKELSFWHKLKFFNPYFCGVNLSYFNLRLLDQRKSIFWNNMKSPKPLSFQDIERRKNLNTRMK